MFPSALYFPPHRHIMRSTSMKVTKHQHANSRALNYPWTTHNVYSYLPSLDSAALGDVLYQSGYARLLFVSSSCVRYNFCVCSSCVWGLFVCLVLVWGKNNFCVYSICVWVQTLSEDGRRQGEREENEEKSLLHTAVNRRSSFSLGVREREWERFVFVGVLQVPFDSDPLPRKKERTFTLMRALATFPSPDLRIPSGCAVVAAHHFTDVLGGQMSDDKGPSNPPVTQPPVQLSSGNAQSQQLLCHVVGRAKISILANFASCFPSTFLLKQSRALSVSV